MDNVVVNRLMRIINTLSLEKKLEILTKLSENLKMNFNSKNNPVKEELIDDLFGSWSNLSDKLSDEVINARTSSDKKISFE